MESVGLILLDIITLLVIVLICVYLTQDRRRFRVERQFVAVRADFDAWVTLASRCPACASAADAYFSTRNVSKKYARLAELYKDSRGAETEAMMEQEAELLPFCAVYNALAEEYNRRLMGKLREPVMRILGFRPLPKLSFGE